MFEMGLGYSSICSARSALNCIVCLPGYSDITEHPLLKRFIKGVFNMRPPKPRYSHTWDINVVLNYINNMGPNYALSLKQISLKLVTLLTLLAVQRVETIPAFTVDNMILTQNDCTFLPSKLLKHSRPSYVNKPVTYRVFPYNVNLCPVAAIKDYDSRRSLMFLRNPSFIITHGKPHKPAHKDTIARWVKELMKLAGIDTGIFKPHSCRSASASAAKRCAIPIDHILQQGNWSNASTFYKFYSRELSGQYDKVGHDVGTSLLLQSANSQ